MMKNKESFQPKLQSWNQACKKYGNERSRNAKKIMALSSIITDNSLMIKEGDKVETPKIGLLRCKSRQNLSFLVLVMDF